MSKQDWINEIEIEQGAERYLASGPESNLYYWSLGPEEPDPEGYATAELAREAALTWIEKNYFE